MNAHATTSAPLSLSNHWTGPTPEGRWLKVAATDEPWATDAIIYDGMIHKTFGHKIDFGITDHKVSFVMDNYGHPYMDMSVDEMLRVVESIRNTDAPVWLKTTDGYLDRARQRCFRRYDDDTSEFFAFSAAMFDACSESDMAGNSLVHTDLHLNNIMRDDDTGVVTVIDWESAVRAHPDMELAHIFHTYALRHTDTPEEERQKILDAVSDKDCFISALKSKMGSSVSWLYGYQCHHAEDK